MGHTKESYMHSAAITRTVVRLAAMEAGVAPLILDEITGEISARNRQARTVDEIFADTELLIRRICGEVQCLGKESPLVSKVRNLIQRHYMEDLSVEEMSQYLGLPKSRLIEKVRKETGSTPGQLLRQVRLSRARQELLFTGKSIQEISAAVGIADAGYFNRLFRAEYGMTPKAFRDRGRGKEGEGV